MASFCRIILPLVALTLMVACTSNPRVQSDYNGDLDFGQYRSFDFSHNTEIEDFGIAGELKRHVSAAVMQELHARGLEISNDPDILINVSVNLNEVSRLPRSGGSICPRYDDYYSQKIYTDYSTVSVERQRLSCSYTEGSFVVELTDIARNQRIMEGVAQVRLDKNDRGNSLLMSVSNDVATFFSESHGS